MDVGGGIGRFSEPLLEKEHEVFLTDISSGMLNKAKDRLSEFPNVTFGKESVIEMRGQKENSFDVVIIMNAILDYCGDYNQAIKEAFRVLKPGGLNYSKL